MLQYTPFRQGQYAFISCIKSRFLPVYHYVYTDFHATPICDRNLFCHKVLVLKYNDMYLYLDLCT